MLTRFITTTLYMLFLSNLSLARLIWGTTEFLFTFGDSYTTDGFNISAGVDSPVPGFVSGPPSQERLCLMLQIDFFQWTQLGTISRGNI